MVVRLGFRDESTVLLAPDEPLARALRAVADALVKDSDRRADADA